MFFALLAASCRWIFGLEASALFLLLTFAFGGECFRDLARTLPSEPTCVLPQVRLLMFVFGLWNLASFFVDFQLCLCSLDLCLFCARDGQSSELTSRLIAPTCWALQRVHTAAKKCTFALLQCQVIRDGLCDTHGGRSVTFAFRVLPHGFMRQSTEYTHRFDCFLSSREWPLQVVFDQRQQSHLSFPHGAPAFCSATMSIVRPCSWVLHEFDAARGYPGEGPKPPDRMKCVSGNIGSLQTNPSWTTWDADVICLQETRVGKNNRRNARKLFETVGLTPCLGELLTGNWH